MNAFAKKTGVERLMYNPVIVDDRLTKDVKAKMNHDVFVIHHEPSSVNSEVI